MTTKPFNWKIFFILLGAATWGVIAITPYSLALQNTDALKALPIPLEVLIPLQWIQNAVMFAIVIGIGLFLANRTGLGLPILEAKLAGEPVGEQVKAILPISIILGVVGSVLIIVIDVFVFSPLLTAELGDKAATLAQAQPAAWKGLLASFYGGITEEVLLRLFVMTLLVWLGKFVSHTEDGRPTAAVLWIANILAAVLFGLGHLPATAAVMPITTLVVIRAILLNGVIGVACGYLYAKRGLESAMISHFAADIVLHVLLAL